MISYVFFLPDPTKPPSNITVSSFFSPRAVTLKWNSPPLDLLAIGVIKFQIHYTPLTNRDQSVENAMTSSVEVNSSLARIVLSGLQMYTLYNIDIIPLTKHGPLESIASIKAGKKLRKYSQIGL